MLGAGRYGSGAYGEPAGARVWQVPEPVAADRGGEHLGEVNRSAAGAGLRHLGAAGEAVGQHQRVRGRSPDRRTA